jgi:hypothetical protein
MVGSGSARVLAWLVFLVAFALLPFDRVRAHTGESIRTATARDLLAYAEAVYQRIGGTGTLWPGSASASRREISTVV